MSFWKHCYHIVWSTKGRAPLILPKIEPRLYAYLVSKAAEMGVFVYAINEMADHGHIIAAIPPKHSVAWVVKMLKGASSHFVNTELRQPGLHFAWQRGYGSLTSANDNAPRPSSMCSGRKSIIAIIRPTSGSNDAMMRRARATRTRHRPRS
jgi:putative transposase